jgi:hypothetical protein
MSDLIEGSNEIDKIFKAEKNVQMIGVCLQ